MIRFKILVEKSFSTKSGKNRENFFIFVESLGAGTKGSKIEVKSIETFQLEMAIT